MTEAYTKYEKARILGARALQLSMNAPIILNIPKEKLEEMNYDPLKIAELEFESRILPITIKRPFPKKEEVLEEEEAEEIEEEIVVEEPVAPEEKKEEKVARVKENKKEMETEEEADEEEEVVAEPEEP